MQYPIVMYSIAFLAMGWGVENVVASNDVVSPSGAHRSRSRARDAGLPSVAGDGGGNADVPLGGTNEPNVAVNPTNPLNVAYASLWELRVSNDAGATFGPVIDSIVPPTHFRFFGGDPSLGFDREGRLFWAYLAAINNELEIFIAQADPTTGSILSGYPVNVTASPGVDLPAGTGLSHDKEWLAVDAFPGSPFVGSLYVSWTEFSSQGTRALTTFSRDQGATWGPAVQISAPGEAWPVHNTVAPNGDVYVSYHSASSGLANGEVFVARSVDGGKTFPQRTQPYGPGRAGFTFNVQNGGSPIPGTTFWLQGSAQAWVMADPNIEGRIYVVANDDPDDNLGSGDPADVFIAISEDHGVTWLPPRRIDSGPGTTFQVMPTAAIDPDSGCIAVHYFDNRNGNLNAAGHFLLDVFATTSVDGGLTFAPDFQINDVPFDPDPDAPVRFSGPPPTTRIGEYNGIAIGEGLVHAVWTGNTVNLSGDPIGQQTITDAFVCTECVPANCGDGDPCNGTEACDPDSGLCLRTLTDCNENGIDDVCDVNGCNGDPACSDCNANGVPDHCDLFGTLIVSSPDLSPVASGQSLNYEIELPLEPVSDVTFSFAASADLGDPSNGIEVQINGVVIGSVFEFGAQSCPLVPDTAQLILSAEEFNAIPSFGLYAIALIPFGDVSSALCPSYVSLTVQYETQTGPDCNKNNIPDECEPDCQPNGIPDECEFADGSVDDCQPNGVPDACDIASGTSSDANGTGIPDECEPCTSNDECNENGVCEFGRCLDGVCDVTSALYGDVAGAGGACGPDGSIELTDILAILDGFAGTFRDGCELVNIDIAGSQGSCTPNNLIDLSDVLNILDAFQGLDRCCANRR